MTVEARLAELGLTLPGPYPPHDPLDAVVVHGGVARTSGQLPARPRRGCSCTRAGSATTLTVEQGAEAARWCALERAVGVLQVELGGLDRDRTGADASSASSRARPDFLEQPAVVDGASRLLADVFGDAGRHSRSAIGVAALPRGGAVEIEVAVALR